MPKQKDGRYRKKITIPGVGVKYASGTTRRELEENARWIREKFIDGIDPRSVTFQELILEWFNVINRRHAAQLSERHQCAYHALFPGNAAAPGRSPGRSAGLSGCLRRHE